MGRSHSMGHLVEDGRWTVKRSSGPLVMGCDGSGEVGRRGGTVESGPSFSEY
jgi:hypothetical protein